jgi:hypothetical protein
LIQTLGPLPSHAAKLTLALLKARILLVDNIKLALSPHDLAIGATLFNGCTNFHDELFVFFIGIMQPAFTVS